MKPWRALSTLARFLVLLVLYGLVALLAALVPNTRKRILVAVLLATTCTLFLTQRGCEHHHPLRVATFNIRCFGAEPTDMARLTELVAELDADVVALQEVQSEPRLGELTEALSHGARRYRYRLASCGGRSRMHVGFLYDERRTQLRETREYPELDPEGDGRCTEGERAALLGVFDDGDAALDLLAVHLSAGGDPERAARRRDQWARAHRIAAELRTAGAREVVILGDANSTGYLDNSHEERDFIDARAREAGMSVATRALGCSEYWHPSDGVLEPSLLDHAVATEGLVREGSARVHGFCAALRCEPHRAGDEPRDYATVSDHCPVTFDLAR